MRHRSKLLVLNEPQLRLTKWDGFLRQELEETTIIQVDSSTWTFICFCENCRGYPRTNAQVACNNNKTQRRSRASQTLA